MVMLGAVKEKVCIYYKNSAYVGVTKVFLFFIMHVINNVKVKIHKLRACMYITLNFSAYVTMIFG